MCGEANVVDMQTVADWNGKIEDLVAGYDPRNVYNGDETGLFFRVLPSKTLTLGCDKCTGGKLSKERLTLYICANITGEIEKPVCSDWKISMSLPTSGSQFPPSQLAI